MKALMKKDTTLKNIIFGGLSLFTSIAFSGCNSVSAKEELVSGKWQPIQITVNGEICESKTYKVAADGGEYKIFSKNYGELWLIGVYENTNRVWPENFESPNYDNIHLTKEWYEIQYDDSRNIVVSISPKEKTATSRSLYLSVEFGDAFSSITLLQE